MTSEPRATAEPWRHAPGEGFTVPDGVALVCGAAVAAVHLRDLVAEQALSAFGWGLVWVTFTGIYDTQAQANSALPNARSKGFPTAYTRAVRD